MAAPTKPRFSKVSWRALCEQADPGLKSYQPVVYEFSGGKSKREPRVPGPYRS
jgi:hypothetical protein